MSEIIVEVTHCINFKEIGTNEIAVKVGTQYLRNGKKNSKTCEVGSAGKYKKQTNKQTNEQTNN